VKFAFSFRLFQYLIWTIELLPFDYVIYLITQGLYHFFIQNFKNVADEFFWRQTHLLHSIKLGDFH